VAVVRMDTCAAADEQSGDVLTEVVARIVADELFDKVLREVVRAWAVVDELFDEVLTEVETETAEKADKVISGGIEK
jgi:hypothetical protein